MTPTWLASVIDGYLEQVGEREFDAPLMALLGARGFYDVHLVHGVSEFGKDIIAKEATEIGPVQWTLQSKAGDIGTAEWRTARDQLEEMRISSLSHPNFASDLPRQVALVTTGRLVGNAPISAQDYNVHLRSRGENPFVLWDRSILADYLGDTPHAGLAAMPGTDLPRFIGSIDEHAADETSIELFSRRWLDPRSSADMWRAGLEAAVAANRFAATEQLDLAALTSLALLRCAIAARAYSVDIADVSETIAAVARLCFRHYAFDLFDLCADATLSPRALVAERGALLAYPARCLRIAEILGLLALEPSTEAADRDRLTAYLGRFVAAHPGARHPLSDTWAVSVIPPALVIGRSDPPALDKYLTDIVKWTADRYEQLGLAAVNAPATEEATRLLGGPFEFVALRRRADTYVGAVILDLAAVFERRELYELALNELLAVRVRPAVIEAEDGPDQFRVGGPGLIVSVDPGFKSTWSPTESWKVAGHHERCPDPYSLAATNPWDHLAICSILRDRHFVTTLRILAQSRPLPAFAA